VIYRPDGERFLTLLELNKRREEAEERAEKERRDRELAEKRAELAEKQAGKERHDKEKSQIRAQRLAEQLRKLGIEPEA